MLITSDCPSSRAAGRPVCVRAPSTQPHVGALCAGGGRRGAVLFVHLCAALQARAWVVLEPKMPRLLLSPRHV